MHTPTTLRATTRLMYRNASPEQLAEAVTLLTLQSAAAFARGDRRWGHIRAAEAFVVARMIDAYDHRRLRAKAEDVAHSAKHPTIAKRLAACVEILNPA